MHKFNVRISQQIKAKSSGYDTTSYIDGNDGLQQLPGIGQGLVEAGGLQPGTGIVQAAIGAGLGTAADQPPAVGAEQRVLFLKLHRRYLLVVSRQKVWIWSLM